MAKNITRNPARYNNAIPPKKPGGLKLLPVVRKNIRRAPAYNDRPPTQEELQRLLEIADLQGRVIITFTALGGFRPSTLVRLKYRHMREDLERGIIPVHVHVEAQITKGQYSDYDTFLAKEAVDQRLLEYAEDGDQKDSA